VFEPKLIKAAKVKGITLRYTCATWLLQAGEPVHVVSKRLGHARVEITWNTYAHVLPGHAAAGGGDNGRAPAWLSYTDRN
jgi:integrase